MAFEKQLVAVRCKFISRIRSLFSLKAPKATIPYRIFYSSLILLKDFFDDASLRWKKWKAATYFSNNHDGMEN